MNNTPIEKLTPIVIIIISMVLFMEFLDTSILNTAIPTIAHQFHENPIILKFAVASYYIGLSIFIPISGYCVDRFGTKFMFISSIFLFILASYLCTTANNTITLSIYRLIQGTGGALMNPTARIILTRLVTSKNIIQVQGKVFTIALLGTICGPIIGGIITNYFSWEWIFYINIPIGLFCIIFSIPNIKQFVPQHIPKFDIFGFLLVAISLTCIAISTEFINHTEILSPHRVGLLLSIGLILLGVLIYYCRNNISAIFQFNVFNINSFKVGFGINITLYMTMSAISFMLPLMFQESFNKPPAIAGLLISPLMLGYIVGRSCLTRFLSIWSYKQLLYITIVTQIISLILIAQINYTTSLLYIIFFELLLGFSSVIIMSISGGLNYIDMPKNKISNATSLDITFRQFSSSIGISLCSFLLLSYSRYLHLNLFSGDAKVFSYTFYTLAGLLCINVFYAKLLPNKNHSVQHKENTA